MSLPSPLMCFFLSLAEHCRATTYMKLRFGRAVGKRGLWGSARLDHHLGTSTMCCSALQRQSLATRETRLPEKWGMSEGDQAGKLSWPLSKRFGYCRDWWQHNIVLLVVISSDVQTVSFLLTCGSTQKSAGAFSLASISTRSEIMIAFPWRYKRCISLVLLLVGMLSMIRGSPLQESSSSAFVSPEELQGFLALSQPLSHSLQLQSD